MTLKSLPTFLVLGRSADARATRDPDPYRRFGCVVRLAALLALASILLPATGRAAGTLYVSSSQSETVSAYSIATNGTLSVVPGSPFNAAAPLGVAATPNGRYLYVADTGFAAGVSAFSIAADGALTPVTGSPFPAKAGTWGLAISPDGKHLYAADSAAKDVSAYTIESDGSLSAVPGSPFAAGTGPANMAIAPNGQDLYVANEESNNVSAFSIAEDGALSAVSGSPYPAGESPRAVSLTPDGKHLYVADQSSETITAFSIASNGKLAPVAGSPYAAPWDQLGVAVTPDGKRLYSTSSGAGEPLSGFSIAEDGTLSPIGGSPFTAGGDHANSVAIAPDSRHLFVSNFGEFEWEPGDGPTNSTVAALSIAAGGSLSAVSGSPFATGYGPTELAVIPDQGPEAAFTAEPAPASDPTTFDATASSDPDYPLASYKWNFGDGESETTSSPTTTHTYAATGPYVATLTVTDGAGCSTAQLFTGQTVSCNGSSKAEVAHTVTVPTGFSLGVSSAGSGSGSVASSPSGIACPETCSYAYEPGTQVTLSATPTSGSRFAGWEGAGCSGTGMCQVTVGSETAVTATFEKLPVLSVSMTGSGTGSLESSPSGIACPGTCSHAYPPGTQVTLTPTASSGSTFAGWEGAGCSGTGTCRVTTNADTDLAATFSKAPPPPSETPLVSIVQTPPVLTTDEPAPPPTVRNARQSATKWREGDQLAHVSHRHTPTGTTFSFSLNEPAAVRFSFTQLSQSAHSCLTQVHRLARHNRCNRTIGRGTLSFTGHSGTNAVTFAGRISRTDKLKPGLYRLAITAENTAGRRSAPVTLSFTIVT